MTTSAARSGPGHFVGSHSNSWRYERSRIFNRITQFSPEISPELYDAFHACDSNTWEGGKMPGLPGKWGEILSRKVKNKSVSRRCSPTLEENQVSRPCQTSLRKASCKPSIYKHFLNILCGMCCIWYNALRSFKGWLAEKSVLSTVCILESDKSWGLVASTSTH